MIEINRFCKMGIFLMALLISICLIKYLLAKPIEVSVNVNDAKVNGPLRFSGAIDQANVSNSSFFSTGTATAFGVNEPEETLNTSFINGKEYRCYGHILVNPPDILCNGKVIGKVDK